MNTDMCYLDISKDWIYTDSCLELKAKKYYVSQGKRKDFSIKEDKPWLYGVSYNIDTESNLKSIDYQNSRDCINQPIYNQLNDLNRNAVFDIYKDHVTCNYYPNVTSKWFNNQTKAKLIQSEDNKSLAMRCGYPNKSQSELLQ